MIRDPKARADLEDNFRKTMTQLLAGLATLFAGIVALSAAVIAYLQLSQQQKASHELLISNQVSKGFEQLGSGKPAIRLGGIYALEGVMNTSEEYHKPVLEALSAFVRDGTRTGTGDGPPATDIQAALTVIGRRTAIGPGTPNLANAYIPKADLSNAELSRANPSAATPVGANLSRAELSLANLSGALMAGTNLTGAHLVNANLFGAILFRANLSGAFLIGTNLSDANLTLANISDPILATANLSGANLTRTNLTGADLTGATVSQTQLEEACGIDVKLDPGLTIKPCRR